MFATFTRVVSRALARLFSTLLIIAIAMSLWGYARGDVRKMGDLVQYSLPLGAWACAIAKGEGRQAFGRFLVLQTGIDGSKWALGETPINIRPGGQANGFPSGHTSAAAFGAVAMARSCLRDSIPAQVVVYLLAGFTGSSRVESQRHTSWQVVAGGAWGWLANGAWLSRYDIWFKKFVDWLGRLIMGAAGFGLRGVRAGYRMARAAMPVLGQQLQAASKIRILSLPFAALLLVGATEQAAAEIELSFYIGPQDGHPSEISGNDPAGVGAFSFDAEWEGRSFEAPPHYGLRAVWWQNERLGWALDFNHAKVYADDATLAASGFPVLEFTDGLNLLTAGPMLRFPSADRRWTPYIGAGLGIAIPYVEVQTQAGAPETREYQITGLAATALAGVSFEITDRWSLFGEAKIGHSQIEADLVGGGTLETEVTTRQLNIGVSYRFH